MRDENRTQEVAGVSKRRSIGNRRFTTDHARLDTWQASPRGKDSVADGFGRAVHLERRSNWTEGAFTVGARPRPWNQRSDTSRIRLDAWRASLRCLFV